MFGQIGELKKMYDKYKELQKKLKNLIIRAKQWNYIDANGKQQEWRIIVDLSGEMKLKNLSINDLNLLWVENKQELEDEISAAFQKAQEKAQEVVAAKTKEILWFDPSDMASMMAWGGMPKIPGLS